MVKEALYNILILESGEGGDILPNEITFQQDYKNGLIAEGHYEFMKFIVELDGYVPEHLNYNINEITMHKALNHRKKMIIRFQNIMQGEGMKKAVERLIEENKEDIVKVVKGYFLKKLYAARNRCLKE